jgi:hypothetical protein
MTIKKHTSPFNKLKLAELDGPALLTFNVNNAKLKETKTAAFSIPAGFTCPGAKDCLAWFDREERKLKDGPDAQFRCFAASMEAAFPSVQKSVDRNLAALKRAKTIQGMTELINMSLPSKFYENIRIHADGDFYNQSYFQAWINAARDNPQRLFYGYTKSLPLWVKLRSTFPKNFVLTASRGGVWDALIETNKLRSAKVVFHPEEALAMNLEIDHDDSLARDPHAGDFALLIHGMQKAGSVAAKAKKRMDSENIKYSYSNKK